ncbi:hypothetical protein SH1V18_33600 [Vallitalea longa]|uniref:D-alanyl-D-alanine carboxypeptidase-like core domain-containing protein n=1 Tax=Vallitalea longa TaxID=2936439 RepID=A0A9W5YBD7_9FIRM|nr:M15 family metallopeptidase [Vallitalea longa]GKX30880.1 hypothetical protein SH1V18_33600 [Vallitalea longa]
MYKNIGKIVLIIGALCLVFVLAIGLIKDNKNTDDTSAQGNESETQENTSSEKENIIEELQISEDDLSLEAGDEYKITVNGLMTDGSLKDLTDEDKLIVISNNDKFTVEDGYIKVSEDAKVGENAKIKFVYEFDAVTVNLEVSETGDQKAETNTVKDTSNNNKDIVTNNNANNKDNTIMIDDEGKHIVTNPSDIHVLVNKERNLPSDYKPDDLIKPDIKFSFEGENEKRYLREAAAHALEELVAEANQEGIEIVGVSGFRSYSKQNSIFNYNVNKRGYEAANKISAKPGQSEHQTGLAIDVSCAGVGYALQERFGKLEEGKWLAENAHKFGFIIRYEKGKEDITGYQYEPWHIRYLGKDIAEDIYEKGITYEEYFEQYM